MRVAYREVGRGVGVVLLLGYMQSACMSYNVYLRAPNTAVNKVHADGGRTVYVLFWGARQPDLRACACDPNKGRYNALESMHIRTTFPYMLASVASLGFVVPLKVEWRCADPRADACKACAAQGMGEADEVIGAPRATPAATPTPAPDEGVIGGGT
jgi:hypothetical protein